MFWFTVYDSCRYARLSCYCLGSLRLLTDVFELERRADSLSVSVGGWLESTVTHSQRRRHSSSRRRQGLQRGSTRAFSVVADTCTAIYIPVLLFEKINFTELCII